MSTVVRITLLALLPGILAGPAPAQLPGTDVYLAPLYERGGDVVVGAAANVTTRAGYDNQPWFVDGDAFLYVSAVDTSGATDVFRFDIPTATSVRVTDTPESEYSPTLGPGGGFFSSVRVEMDGTQRLWRFAMDGTSPRLIAAGVDSVGYHAWSDEHTVVVFIVGAPHSLRIVDTDSGVETLVTVDVGRSLQRIPGSDLVSFLRRDGEFWRVMRLDAETGDSIPVAVALEGSQDCAWTPSGRLLMARAGRVYVLSPGDGRWVGVASFGQPGLEAVTRLAVDPTGRWLALVGADRD